ncbi:hypothetical protein DFH08DRAFT_804560 [Mycena albidolilacea]|uniref:Uncharacterized protein n=1 Tax=Mycena albidolilacea TaxID=1033008 RepID=A0AAD7EYN4_9AGAR|nr:hypothetical protein DFH08DRAFT_804560 [Mycena albidolilacea]
MSTRKTKLVKTNICVEELIMDEHGNRDPRYYCVPPMYRDKCGGTGGRWKFHLVLQGHVVGIFANWLEAKSSLTGYPDNANLGFNTFNLCVLGLYPHPIDPALLEIPSASVSRGVNMLPRGSSTRPKTPMTSKCPVKREAMPGRSGDNSAQVLTDLPVCSLAPSPRKGGPSPSAETDETEFVNFAIRGKGIILSSAEQSQQHYCDMQRWGEEPDMLVTRSLTQASIFALEEDEVEGAGQEGLIMMHRHVSRSISPCTLWDEEEPRHANTPIQAFPQLNLEKSAGSVYKDKFLAASKIKQTGALYDKLAQLYLAKYGYHLDWDDDLEDGQNVVDNVDPDEDVDRGGGISLGIFQEASRGMVWYNTQYGGAVVKKPKQVMFRQIFDKPELDPPAPVKVCTLHYFSRHFYHEKIKPRVLTRWAAVSCTANLLVLVTVCNAVTREVWLAQTLAFREEVLAAIEREHKTALEAYALAVAAEAPSTPEQYDVALNNAAYYLQLFADTVHAQYGMNRKLNARREEMCAHVANEEEGDFSANTRSSIGSGNAGGKGNNNSTTGGADTPIPTPTDTMTSVPSASTQPPPPVFLQSGDTEMLFGIGAGGGTGLDPEGLKSLHSLLNFDPFDSAAYDALYDPLYEQLIGMPDRGNLAGMTYGLPILLPPPAQTLPILPVQSPQQPSTELLPETILPIVTPAGAARAPPRRPEPRPTWRGKAKEKDVPPNAEMHDETPDELPQAPPKEETPDETPDKSPQAPPEEGTPNETPDEPPQAPPEEMPNETPNESPPPLVVVSLQNILTSLRDRITKYLESCPVWESWEM